MKLSDFDQSITLAQNENTVISAARWGKVWRFFMKHFNDDLGGFEVGLPFDSKQALLNNSYNYLLKSCNCGFKESDLLPIVPKLTTVTLTQDQKVAINTAIRLIGNSESDHADQCYFYLKQIAENF